MRRRKPASQPRSILSTGLLKILCSPRYLRGIVSTSSWAALVSPFLAVKIDCAAPCMSEAQHLSAIDIADPES